MRKKIAVLFFVAASVAAPIEFAHALRVAPLPGPVRVAGSDAVFVGRVIELEPTDVDARSYPQAKETVKYRIGIVKVNEVIRGLTKEKTVRVGFIAPANPGKPIGPIIGGRRPVTLEVGQEGLFMISKHHEGKFYLAPIFEYFTSMAAKNFDDEVKTAKKTVAILANSKTALQSKDADERLLAASLLIHQYRTPKTFPNKEVPIDAEESKLILNAIATAKWGPFRFGDAHPQQMFFQLGIGEKDGFITPKRITSPDDLRIAVQNWVQANAGTYRIKRFVPAPK